MRLASVSVDLDEIHHYLSLHGLGSGAKAEPLVYDHAVARSLDFAQALGISLTYFAVGRDLERSESAAALKKAVSVGHEVGNHSLSHRYDLTRCSRAEMEREVTLGSDLIERSVGERPVGFRAPGYTVSDELFEVLAETSVRYDSSVFPCPPYYAAKGVVMLLSRAVGRRSSAIFAPPHALRAPTRPYRIGRPFSKPGRGLAELPIQVTPKVRLPYIGTSLVLSGPDAARLLTRTLLREPFVNLELHGLDFLGVEDGLAELGAHQPDAKLSLERKLSSLAAAVELLQRHGFSFVRLDAAASALVP
jgi:peptidoglycan/xylan/chitin deacetylase (PgdA/CDA1 family)